MPRSWEFWHIPLVAAALTLLLVGVIVAVSPPTTFQEDYTNAAYFWDSGFYVAILEVGYTFFYPPVQEVFPLVVFLPGYPFVAWIVHVASGLSIRESLVLASHLALWGFWMYVLAFLRRWKTPLFLRCITVLGIMMFPMFFFMGLAYTESFYMFALLGFLFWTTAEGRATWILAALHGLAVGSTRVVGIPTLLYPPFDALMCRLVGGERRLRWRSSLAASAFSSLGLLAFLLYSHVKFGFWNAFMLGQQSWGHSSDFLRLFKWQMYVPTVGALGKSGVPVDFFVQDLFSVIFVLFMIAFIWAIVYDVVRHRGDGHAFAQRVAWYVLCVGMLFVYVSTVGRIVDGRYLSSSLPRYLMTIYIVMALALAWQYSPPRRLSRISLAASAFVIVGFALCTFPLQLYLLSLFFRSVFVG